MVLSRAGALRPLGGGGGPAAPEVSTLLRSGADCFLDLDGDHEAGEGEPKGPRALAVAVALPTEGEDGRQGRAVVYADADLATDQLLAPSPGNAQAVVDLLAWLLEDETVKGAVESEEDVAIEHRRDEDRTWFYGTTYGVPVPVLLSGWWVHRRRRRRAEAHG